MQQGKLELEAFAGAILGARSEQEDASRIWQRSTGGPAELLLLTADGLGGHASGEVASNLVCDAVTGAFERAEGPIVTRLRKALDAGHTKLKEAIAAKPALDGMGTTLLAVHIDQHGMSWLSVGDTALMLFRDGRLQRLNDDHSLGTILDQQAKAGLISEAEARANPKRNALRSAVASAPIALVNVQETPMPLLPGDRVLLATDGLLTLQDQKVEEIVANGGTGSAKSIVEALLEAVEARASKGQDNTTIVALAVYEGPVTRIVSPAKAASARPAATAEAAVVRRSSLLLPISILAAALAMAALALALFQLRPPVTTPDKGAAVPPATQDAKPGAQATPKAELPVPATKPPEDGVQPAKEAPDGPKHGSSQPGPVKP